MNNENDKNQISESELDDLVKSYQDLKAPSHLSSKIIANVETEQAEKIDWFPVFSGAFALLLISVFIFIPTMENQQQNTAKFSSIPSLSQASKLLPKKPTMSIPSLSSVKGVSSHVTTPSRKNIEKLKDETKQKFDSDSKRKKQNEDSENSIKRLI